MKNPVTFLLLILLSAVLLCSCGFDEPSLSGKLLQFETLPKLPAIADIFKNEVETSAEVFDSAHLANVLRGISSEQPISVMLPGSTAENDYTIWIPDGAGIQNRMQELFRPSDIEQSESTDKEEKND